jgi:hypothetical protein
MLFVEYGQGPTKYNGGEFGEQLKFFTRPSHICSARIEIDGRRVALPPFDDLNFQAITRGGRVMDHVLGNKAVFKQATDTVGDVALMGAVVAADRPGRNTDKTALALATVGILSKIASSATTPQADIRAWDNLPQYLSFAALELSPGEHAATLEFLDAQAQPVRSLTQNITISVPPADPSVGAKPSDIVIFLSELKK